MNGKQFSASILLAGIIGMASPLQASPVQGALGGAAGGIVQGSAGSLVQGQFRGTGSGRADAAMPETQADPRLIGRGGAAAHQAATRSQQIAADRAAGAGSTAGRARHAAVDRAESGRERVGHAAEGTVATATGLGGHAKERAGDVTPKPEQPGVPARPDLTGDSALELGGSARSDSSIERSDSSAEAQGALSGEASAWTSQGVSGSAEGSGAFQAGVRAEQPQRERKSGEPMRPEERSH